MTKFSKELTLRDYFAIKCIRKVSFGNVEDKEFRKIAYNAYRQADAMLQERTEIRKPLDYIVNKDPVLAKTEKR